MVEEESQGISNLKGVWPYGIIYQLEARLPPTWDSYANPTATIQLLCIHLPVHFSPLLISPNYQLPSTKRMQPSKTPIHHLNPQQNECNQNTNPSPQSSRIPMKQLNPQHKKARSKGLTQSQTSVASFQRHPKPKASRKRSSAPGSMLEC